MRELMWIIRALTPFACKIYGHEFETYSHVQSESGESMKEQCCLHCAKTRKVKI